MNKTIIAERFSKAISTYPREANVQRQIADKMIHLLQKHIPSPCPKVIEFGCGTGIYSRMLLRTLRPEELLLNDLCPEMRYCCEDLLREKQVSFLSGDAEIVGRTVGDLWFDQSSSNIHLTDVTASSVTIRADRLESLRLDGTGKIGRLVLAAGTGRGADAARYLFFGNPGCGRGNGRGISCRNGLPAGGHRGGPDHFH